VDVALCCVVVLVASPFQLTFPPLFCLTSSECIGIVVKKSRAATSLRQYL